MKERPIIFSGPMIRAIIEGRKTQTRRVAKVPLDAQRVRFVSDIDGSLRVWVAKHSDGTCHPIRCPYGQPGDLLWVRETFAKRYADAERDPSDGIMYRADGGCIVEPRWTPAIHMPRWASRLTLRITDVRVQRVQEITNADIQAEGTPGLHPLGGLHAAQWMERFRSLWDSINAKRGYPWQSNPPVWVITFEREATK